jgi:hypothetical protein
MTNCKLCNAQISEDKELCEICRAKLGIRGGSGVRPPKPCERCNHPELIRALVRELTVDAGNDPNFRRSVPMAVTYDPVRTTSFWTDQPKGTAGVDETRPRGILEMYVCAKCGFTEWYCRDPGAIPIGEEYGTEKVSVEGKTPYR